MRALVTGATGFIGLQLVNRLKKSGYLVRILSRFDHPEYDTVTCDLEQQSIPDMAFDKVDVIFHLAGFAHDIKSSQGKCNSYYNLNVHATILLAEKAVEHNVNRFIFVSSVKAGGVHFHDNCMSESNQSTPFDAYGLSKRTAEIAILKIGKESGMHVSIVRPSLVYGDNMKGNLHTMYRGIERGWFPPLPKVRNMRSMICVHDLVRAILLVSITKSSNGNVYIVTDGVLYSSRYIYEIMCNALNKRIPKMVVPLWIFYTFSKVGDLFESIPFSSYSYGKLFGNECYSSEKIQKLGFRPRYNFKDFLLKIQNEK